jgi:hypothetical protein
MLEYKITNTMSTDQNTNLRPNRRHPAHGILFVDGQPTIIFDTDDCLVWVGEANNGASTRFDALVKIWDHYKSIHSPHGGFGEYVSPRGWKVNRELGEAADRLWGILWQAMPN